MTVTRTAPASFGQRLLWLMEHYRGTGSILNVPVFYRIHGALDRSELRAAFDVVATRHEALRTTYEGAGRRLIQLVHAPEPVPLTQLRVDGGEAELAAAMLAEACVPFDLTASPVRVVLFEIAPDDHMIMLNIHHLSTDGWSGGVLSEELSRLYRPGRGPVDPALSACWQYVDFSEWQRQRFEDGELAEHQKFWRAQLAGARPPGLPERNAGCGAGPMPRFASFTLDEEAATGLTRLCRTQRVTPFIAGLALFASVLHTRTGDTDFAIASMFANRPHPQLIGTVGFLANLLVLRVKLPKAPTFTEVLTHARDVVFDALDHQDVPYHLVPQAQGERSAGLENILFQVMAGPAYAPSLEGLKVRQASPPSGIGSRFDLEFALIPEPKSLSGMVWYDEQRFDQAWIHRLIADYTRMAQTAIADPGRPVTEHLAD